MYGLWEEAEEPLKTQEFNLVWLLTDQDSSSHATSTFNKLQQLFLTGITCTCEASSKPAPCVSLYFWLGTWCRKTKASVPRGWCLREGCVAAGGLSRANVRNRIRMLGMGLNKGQASPHHHQSRDHLNNNNFNLIIKNYFPEEEICMTATTSPLVVPTVTLMACPSWCCAGPPIQQVAAGAKPECQSAASGVLATPVCIHSVYWHYPTTVVVIQLQLPSDFKFNYHSIQCALNLVPVYLVKSARTVPIGVHHMDDATSPNGSWAWYCRRPRLPQEIMEPVHRQMLHSQRCDTHLDFS